MISELRFEKHTIAWFWYRDVADPVDPAAAASAAIATISDSNAAASTKAGSGT